MKKLSAKRKRFLINKNLKEIRRKRKRKNLKFGQSISAKKFNLMQSPEFKEIEAPKELTLRYENAENALNFIQKIKNYGNKGYFIYLKLENVEIIAEGAISMLLSVISDLERKRIFFKGEKPINETAKNILERSGFFSYMQGSVSKQNTVSKNKILKTGTKNTHQKELTPEIHKAMETIWKSKSRCPALYGGIGEMMRNSCDHAFNRQNDIMWHLGISHFENENTCKFSFVDNGAGIINTYNQKGFITKIETYFTNNAEILETAFKDGIKSRTGLSWRGKGLPTIYEMYEDKIITNLIIITNNVYLDFDRKINETLSSSFSGTYYFWNINDKCQPSYFKI